MYLPGVVAAKYVKDYKLDVSFNDGTRKKIDVSQWFKGPVFEPLREKAFFKKFFVEAGTVAWPNGVDIAPEALYDAENVSARPPVRNSGRGSARGRKAS
jgi:hypothetical protein